MFLSRFESKCQPLLNRLGFIKRLTRCMLLAGTLVVFSLIVGICGYHYLERMPWIDSFANAAMILSGMGPLSVLQTFTGKLFAGVYALYSGLVLIIATGIIIAPIVHRVMHRFHLESAQDKDRDE